MSRPTANTASIEPVTDEERLTTLVDILQRASGELTALSVVADDVQNSISGLLSNANHEGTIEFERLQELDRLTQSLTSIANFLNELAHTAPEDWRLNASSAARQLPLRDLAQRIAGEVDETCDSPKISGDCDFF